MTRFRVRFRHCSVLIVAAYSVFLSIHAHAVTTSWNTDVSGTFATAANWDNGVPDSDDTAIFNRGFVGYTVTFPGGTIFEPPVNYAINYLRVPHNHVNFVWNSSFPLQASPSLSVLNPDVSIVIGENAGEVGILGTTLASFSGANTSIGRAPGANGTLNVVGGSFSMSNSLVVGDSGSGTLNITTGGSVTSAGAVISGAPGSNGIATVTGAGSTWTDSASLIVGDGETGALTIADGGSVSSVDGTIGSQSGAIGTVTVTGTSSTWSNGGSLAVGGQGFFVGFGRGTLTIEAGGSVSSNNGSIFGTNSTVTVNGTGSTWTNGGGVGVGSGGTLTIEAGGSVSNGTGIIGDTSTGGSGTVVVTGAGSNWANSDRLTVGEGSTLTIEAGGSVSNESGTIAGLNSRVTVTGLGSTWTNSGDLTIGGTDLSGSSNSLLVSNGGAVSVGALLFVEPAGTVTGNGTLSAIVINRGVVSPGLNPGVLAGVSPGALDVDGNYLQSAAGKLRLRLAGTTPGSDYDQLHVNGAVTLNGTLSVALANSFVPSAGDAFDILDWGSLNGTFDTLQLPALSAGLTWITSQLYVTGVLSVGLPGDYNFDGKVDAADYVVWRKNDGTQQGYDTWRANFGRTSSVGRGETSSVPEPATVLSLAIGVLIAVQRRRNIPTWRKPC